MMLSLWLALAAALSAAPPLHLDELVREALENNPEIIAARQRFEATRLRAAQAGGLPETMISAGWAGSGRPWPGAGLGMEPMANLGLMVTQEFPFPGKRRLRSAIAGKEAAGDAVSYEQVEWSVAARVKRAYWMLAHAEVALDVLARNREVLTHLEETVQARYAVGKASQADVFRTQMKISQLAAAVLDRERERASREGELVSLLGRRPGSRLGNAPFLVPAPPPAPIEDLFERARARAPAIRRQEVDLQRSQLSLELARRGAYPDYALSGGYFNMGRMRDVYQFRVDLKLPWFDRRRQRAEVAEQSALVGESRRVLEATQQSLAAAIREEYLNWDTAVKRMRLYETTVARQAELAFEAALAGYQTGAATLDAVLDNALEVLEAEMNYHDEMMKAHLAAARLVELTAIPLDHASAAHGGKP